MNLTNARFTSRNPVGHPVIAGFIKKIAAVHFGMRRARLVLVVDAEVNVFCRLIGTNTVNLWNAVVFHVCLLSVMARDRYYHNVRLALYYLRRPTAAFPEQCRLRFIEHVCLLSTTTTVGQSPPA